jgi:hypothetical protein
MPVVRISCAKCEEAAEVRTVGAAGRALESVCRQPGTCRATAGLVYPGLRAKDLSASLIYLLASMMIVLTRRICNGVRRSD